MTFIRLSLFFLISIVFFACNEKKDISFSADTISADSVISQEKMILILSDIHLVEAAMQIERNTGVPAIDKQNCYREIFKKYHVTSRRYDQNLSYYRQKPEIYAKMYEKVVEIIDTRKT